MSLPFPKSRRQALKPLRQEVDEILRETSGPDVVEEEQEIGDDAGAPRPPDFRRLAMQKAVENLRNNRDFNDSMERQGLPWGVVVGILKNCLPQSMQDRNDLAYTLVKDAVIEVVGQEDVAWHTERKVAKSSGHESTWIVPGPNPNPNA